MSNKQKQVQYLVKQSQQPEVAVAPPRYQPPPQPPQPLQPLQPLQSAAASASSGILKSYAAGLPKDGKTYPAQLTAESAPPKQPFPSSVPNLKLYPLSTQQQYPYVGAPVSAQPQRLSQRHSDENLGTTGPRPGPQESGRIPQQPGPQQRQRTADEELLRAFNQNKAKLRITDEEFLRMPPVEMLKFVKKTELESSKYSSEQNKHMQTLVNELRILKESNQRLSDDNQELRDLCCFLDDDRQKGRKLAREWQRFGRYTASVMRQEVSAYQNKLRELDNKQQELIKDNLELKELCLYLDEERSGSGMCPSCGVNNGGSLRDDGDGSSSSTNADEPQVPAQFAENGGNVPRRSASRERILHENLSRQRSTFTDQTMQYVRNLEVKIKQLEEEKKVLHNKLMQAPIPSADPGHAMDYPPALSGRPEAVVRALQVLEVREQLEREGHVERSVDGNVDDNSSADMDDCEKALVREMCNVVWRKLEEGPSNGRH